jgi:hypothetical protein
MCGDLHDPAKRGCKPLIGLVTAFQDGLCAWHHRCHRGTGLQSYWGKRVIKADFEESLDTHLRVSGFERQIS